MSGIGICPATLLTDPMSATDAEVRVAAEAAASAGFTEASVWGQHIGAVTGSGLAISVVEAATGWANGTPEDAAREARTFTGLASQCGAGLILAVCLEPSLADLGRARHNLGLLVDAAVEAEQRVCVEFLPWSGIPDLSTAWALVEPLGPGAGIVLDTWHWQRQPGGPALETLAAIPGDRIPYVQVCDASATPGEDAMTEAMTARLLPGLGVVDFPSLFSALAAIGAEPFVAAEIFNPGLVERDGPKAAAIAMRAAAGRVVA